MFDLSNSHICTSGPESTYKQLETYEETKETALDTASGTFGESIDWEKEGILKHEEYMKLLCCWLQSYSGGKKKQNK